MIVQITILIVALQTAFAATGDNGRTLITDVVYADMINEFAAHPANEKVYGAYFLEQPVTNKSVLALCTNSIVRIETTTNNVRIKNGFVRDALTKKRGVVFFSRLKSESRDEATVTAGWHSDPEGACWMKYKLRRSGTNWIVVSKKVEKIS